MDGGAAQHHRRSINSLALSATIHCLTGCAIGEVLGMVVSTALHWGDMESILLSILLAFVFGYSLTLIPLLGSRVGPAAALRMALASDTFSIVVMEVCDNAIMLLIPGAMESGLDDLLFWASLLLSLAIAGAAAFPLNRWLIARGRGHAVVQGHHH